MSEKEIYLPEDMAKRYKQLKEEVITTIGDIVFSNLKRLNNGKDPTYHELTLSYFHLYSMFCADLLTSNAEGIKEFDKLCSEKKEVKP